MKNLLEREKACAIDVDPSNEFQRMHIRGTVNIASTEKNFPQKVSNTAKKTDNVILYGSKTSSSEISKLAKDLEKDGYKNVYAYHGNLADWNRSGLDVQRQ
jgi:rhodanese-related sulfurtransferase